MTIFNETSKERISQAYDLFKKEDFLERLFKFMEESEHMIQREIYAKAHAEKLIEDLTKGEKTKKGKLRENGEEKVNQ